MIFKSISKITLFQELIKKVNRISDFRGFDDNDEPIYEHTVRPTINFKGLVKLHGTNMGISYSPSTGIIAQKKREIIEKDHLRGNYGINVFVQVNKKRELTELISSLWEKNCSGDDIITIFGEWAGKGVQTGVGISKHDKAFYIFDCRIFDPINGVYRYLDISDLEINIDGVYNLNDFETYSIDIDFDNLEPSQETLIKITNEIEENCPVAHKLGEGGIGEGAVWVGNYEGTRLVFKTKGKLHAGIKTEKLVNISTEVLESIDDFVEYACTINRIEQAIQETDSKNKSDMPKLIKWISTDIITEENSAMVENNLDWKQVSGKVNNKVREYFFNKINEREY